MYLSWIRHCGPVIQREIHVSFLVRQHQTIRFAKIWGLRYWNFPCKWSGKTVYQSREQKNGWKKDLSL